MPLKRTAPLLAVLMLSIVKVALSSWGAFIQEVAGMESQDREATALYCPLTAIQGRHQIDPGLKGGCDG